MVYEKLRATLAQSLEEDGVGVILDTLCIIFQEDYPKRGDMKLLTKYLYHANAIYHTTDMDGTREELGNGEKAT